MLTDELLIKALDIDDSNVYVAMCICIQKHDGQYRDISGLPYAIHPFSVAKILKERFKNYTKEEECAAYLHDVVEDTNFTLKDLEEIGFSDKILNIVELLTQEDDEDYLSYLLKISTDISAIRVKIADVRHNRCDQSDKTKRDRYDLSLYILETALVNLSSRMYSESI